MALFCVSGGSHTYLHGYTPLISTQDITAPGKEIATFDYLSFKNLLHLSGWMGLLHPVIHMVQNHHAGEQETCWNKSNYQMIWTLCLSYASVP